MHMPPDIHVYLKPSLEEGDVLEGWFGVTKADHDAPEMQIRSLPADADIGAEEHLKAMKEQPALSAEEQRRVRQTEWAPAALPGLLDGPLRFYYGFCNGSQMFLLMFKQPERFRLAYSPCGAGKQPAWNPAWDFLLCLEDAELGRTYEWDLCLVVKKFQGRADALAEVESYLK